MLAAVIFDVDGTLVDSERDGHRVAFNRAFQDMGMPDRWGEEEYGTLLRVAGGRERLLHYLGSTGRTGEDALRLAAELHRRKTAWMRRLIDEDAVPPRPGAQRLVSELAVAGLRLAIATTGQRSWVEPLIDRHFGLDTFEQVVTGREVTRLKPDPEVYRLVLRRLGVEPGACLAVEDSANGVRAATGAGIPCLAVTNAYTSRDDLSGAVLVLDGFGPGAHVLREGPVAMPTGTVTAPLLSQLRGALGTWRRAGDQR